jgi:2,5-diketo-D-gluconate reductase A
VTLNNDVEMPILGFGVYQILQEETKQAVLDAIDVGYRLIDTAQSYFNEKEVGEAIAECDVPREDLFITTKVWIENYGYEKCKASVLESMEKLGLDYIDLVLLHQPFADYYGAYRALEELYNEGVLRAIGVSNFYPDRLVDIASFANIVPMVNQVETHVLNQQKIAKQYMDKYGVQCEAWAPFGEGRGGLFENETLINIGKKYGKTAAQVMLRWNIQRGVVVLPKSTHRDRMIQNIDVFDFVLSDADMTAIAALDTATSSFFSHYDPAMVEWFVKMVEERKKNNRSEMETKNW